MTKKRTISIQCPCYNEQDNILLHYNRILKVIEPYNSKYEFEFVYTDNNSTDNSFEIFKEIASNDTRVKVIRFSNNIGYNRAIFQGLSYTSGDAVILIQADLQDPPELIEKFINKWEEGYDVVYGTMIQRDGNALLNLARKIFYRMMASFAENPIPIDSGDFRLCSRVVVDSILAHREDDPFMRSLVARVGFKQCGIEYDRMSRQRGISSFNVIKLVSYALNSIISNSVAPIRLISSLGIILSIIGFGSIFVLIVWKISNPTEAPRGYASLAAIIIFLGGCQLFSLGVIGEYLRKTYLQTLERPLGFIRDSINLK